MTVTAWRIVKKALPARAFDGEGARLHGGRWNGRGHAVVYTSGSVALAMLEILAHTSRSALRGFVVIPAQFDERLVEALDRAALPSRWRAFPAPAALARIGNEWIRERRSAVLKVPSALVPSEPNYLLNPAHPDFAEIRIGAPEALQVDRRLQA